MIHYHGTPITPIAVLYELAGGHFCVSHARPEQVARVHEIGQSVMLDNGAYTKWTKGRPTDWPAYYEWADRWLHYPSTWAVIPDVIGAGTQKQDALIREWPHGQRGAPVWHMDEPITRLLRLCDDWPLVCVGSTDEFRVVLSDLWRTKIDEAFNALTQTFQRIPRLHMLRGMQLSGRQWPFFSVDSTDIAQNHHLPHRCPVKMMKRWDSLQSPGGWKQTPQQMDMI